MTDTAKPWSAEENAMLLEAFKEWRGSRVTPDAFSAWSASWELSRDLCRQVTELAERNAALQGELDRQKQTFLSHLRDQVEDMQCQPTCDSYGHADDCPVTNPIVAWRNLRQQARQHAECVGELEYAKENRELSARNAALREVLRDIASLSVPSKSAGEYAKQVATAALAKDAQAQEGGS